MLPLATILAIALAQAETPPPPPPDVETPPPPPPIFEAPPPPPAVAEPPSAPATALPPRRLTRLTIAPTSLIALSIAFEYERALSERASIFVGPQIHFAGALLPASAQNRQTPSPLGLMVDAGVRFFPIRDQLAPAGFWVGPGVRAYYWTFPLTDEVAVSFGGMGVIGYTLITDGGFTASFGGSLGLAYTSATLSNTTGVPGTGAAPEGIVGMHLNLGFAF